MLVLESKCCYVCGTNKTYIDKKGLELWYKNRPTKLLICYPCYAKYFYNPATRKRWNEINNKKWAFMKPQRRIKYRETSSAYDRRRLYFAPLGKYLRLPTNPKIGVCNWCRAVKPFDCKKTDMHHEQYDLSDPLHYTIELCNACHDRTKKWL